MAEPWKNQYGPEIPRRIAEMVAAVHPPFDHAAFLRDALGGYEALELMDRGRRIAEALRTHLPSGYGEAVRIIVASAAVPVARDDGPMSGFLFLPHTLFVGTYGLGHFEESMAAQYELTQRFTAEFSIRPFLEKFPDATLERLRAWARDPDQHVRRLVSEGTRPRLPWAARLRRFQMNPRPVIALLELLKDDPELYVRRSVSNNLNDIGKDHPDLLVETARHWMEGASPDRRRLVRHALRSAVKRGDPAALAVLGYGSGAQVSVRNLSVTPARVRKGGSVTLAFEVVSSANHPQQVLADFRVHYVKANGTTRPKVFKLREVELAPGGSVSLQKSVSLKEMSTRRHYPGVHRIDILLNGKPHPAASFELTG
ncbi:MAG: hypothetical protein JJU00_15410 [Opitutales bacterium]|nr:hypothetical protein [Opitutales bacterium]